MVKNLPANAGVAGDMGSIPGLGRSPGVGNGNPCHYSCLENSIDRGAWQTTEHAHTHTHTHIRIYKHTHTCIPTGIYMHIHTSKNLILFCFEHHLFMDKTVFHLFEMLFIILFFL